MMLAAAGVMGAVGIAAAAWAQHGLASVGNGEHVKFAQIAARFAVVHAVALIAMAAVAREGIGKGVRSCLGASALCFFGGFVFFCGGLWLLAAGAPTPWAHVIPIGGTLFIIGWLAILAAALAPRPAH
jgi:uncharacterized membrane protein YgdD (TMEM256/DUF423 family)